MSFTVPIWFFVLTELVLGFIGVVSLVAMFLIWRAIRKGGDLVEEKSKS